MSLATLDHAANESAWRHRPLAEKALIGFGGLALCLSLPPLPWAAVVGVAMALLTIFAAKVRARFWLGLAALPMGFLAVGALSLMVQLGPDGFALAESGPTRALELVARSMGATTCLMFLALTTPAADLLAGLRRFGLPAEIVEIALLTYRFVFILGEEAQAMSVARRARLGHATRRRWLRSTAELVACLLPRALARARRMETGLAARGWHGEMRVLSARSARRPACGKRLALIGASQMAYAASAVLFSGAHFGALL